MTQSPNTIAKEDNTFCRSWDHVQNGRTDVGGTENTCAVSHTRRADLPNTEKVLKDVIQK